MTEKQIKGRACHNGWLVVKPPDLQRVTRGQEVVMGAEHFAEQERHGFVKRDKSVAPPAKPVAKRQPAMQDKRVRGTKDKGR